MNGYFKGIKTFIAETGKENFCRIKLIPKTNTGTINATNGGDVILTNGLNISFPANGIMDAVTKAVYSGTVNVASFWIDPTGNDLDKLMPGDLRGINENNSLKGLTTFGMAAVELTGSAGELLQIAEGKTAALRMPIPASILSNAPATIPLWYFDETIGLWREEGSAVKTGTVYIGDVKHFSYWNCDIPTNSLVQFNCTIRDANNNPISNRYVKITTTNNYGCAHGYTDADGYLAGSIPGNAQLMLEMLDDNGCNALSYNFSTSLSSMTLGTLKISGNNTIIISGTVTDCNNNPLINGRMFVHTGNNTFFYNLNENIYSFTVINACTSSITISIDVVNITTNEESVASNYTIDHQNIALPNIIACGQTTAEYSNLSIDSESYILGSYSDGTFFSGGGWSNGSPPFTSFDNTLLKLINGAYVHNGDHIQWSIFHSQTPVSLDNANYTRTFSLYRGADDGYLHVLELHFNNINNPIPFPVTITEYGAIGGYISGHFSGTCFDLDGISHNIAYFFRIKRLN